MTTKASLLTCAAALSAFLAAGTLPAFAQSAAPATAPAMQAEHPTTHKAAKEKKHKAAKREHKAKKKTADTVKSESVKP